MIERGKSKEDSHNDNHEKRILTHDLNFSCHGGEDGEAKIEQGLFWNVQIVGEVVCDIVDVLEEETENKNLVVVL